MLALMGTSSYSDSNDPLRHLYLDDPRPWLAGFSGNNPIARHEEIRLL